MSRLVDSQSMCLTEQEKAVVLARCNGNLKREEIGKALRSCFPDMTLSRKSNAVHAVEDLDTGLETDPEIEFHDIELFLAEHGQSVPESLDPEEFPESEVAEVLAISWKERRAEINRLQKARKFQQVKEMKRQFRVEIEEIKRRAIGLVNVLQKGKALKRVQPNLLHRQLVPLW